MNSIFANSFYNVSPIPVWAYSINIENSNYSFDIMNSSVVKVEIPEIKVNTIQKFYKGISFNLPVRKINNGSFNITFNDNKSLDLRTQLDILFRENFKKDLNEDRTYRNEESKTNIIIKIYRNGNTNTEYDGNLIWTITFKDCYLESISSQDMDYANDSEVVKWTASFKYNDILEERII